MAESQENKSEEKTNGRHTQQEALLANVEMKRTQTLERLGKLANKLQELIQSKVNIHKEIKTKTTNFTTAPRRFKKLDEEWQAISGNNWSCREPCRTFREIQFLTFTNLHVLEVILFCFSDEVYVFSQLPVKK
ncbi:hypothetical protein J6590_065634 [Homalodisca vitripennis]|nr:hypothetical protein J6590_065634 [Homalodisca vitripennis]